MTHVRLLLEASHLNARSFGTLLRVFAAVLFRLRLLLLLLLLLKRDDRPIH